MKFRKKPVVIEAIRIPLTPESLEWGDLAVFLGPGKFTLQRDPLGLLIQTLEGEMRGDLGDWVIRGVQGELYPCKPGIFAATYEPVGDELITARYEQERREAADDPDFVRRQAAIARLRATDEYQALYKANGG